MLSHRSTIRGITNIAHHSLPIRLTSQQATRIHASSSPSSSSSPIARYLTTLFPHAHRPLLTTHQHQRHFGVMNYFQHRTRESLRSIEQLANSSVNDPRYQLMLYRGWNLIDQPHHVITRYESGRVAGDDACYKEYVKAMETLGKGNQIKSPISLNTQQTTQSQQQQQQQPSYSAPRSSYIPPPPQQNAYYPPPPSYQPDLSQHLYGQPSYQYPPQQPQYNPYAPPYQSGYQHPQYIPPVGAGAGSTGGLTPDTALYVREVPVTGGSVARSMVSKLVGLFVSTALIVAFFIALTPIIKNAMAGSGPKEIKPDTDIHHTFADVKGCDEAKSELEEIVQFLKSPQTFTRLGGKLPKGVLLMGPPGTGKTLLAKAIAGEAGVPFFYCAGSEFEEMYVGVGAARIRTLFAAAKKKAPCIVFIDEIDAVGGQRGQRDMSAMRMTLNQLLTEMDGFQENSGVIVIGATNLTQLLDKALVRPGRFDKHVVVPLPDVKGRKQILDLYAGKVKIGPDVDTSVIARATPGCTGADLFNLINSAALRAASNNEKVITMKEMEYAKDKILMGAERTSSQLTLESRTLTAYHEGGHAIMALHTKGAYPLYKATIMPRGQALGMVHQLPETDVTSVSKQQYMAKLDVAMGGREAEKMIFGADAVTSGASSDLQSATSIAKQMVTKWGMSDKVGPISYSDSELGKLSPTTKKTIDDEINALLEASRIRTAALLEAHKPELELLAAALLKYETLDRSEIERVLRGESIPELDAVLAKRVVSSVNDRSTTNSGNNNGPIKPLIPLPGVDEITHKSKSVDEQ